MTDTTTQNPQQATNGSQPEKNDIKINNKPTKTKIIQVSNLPPSIVREELKELCLSCGRVIECEIFRKKGNPTGYVTFLTAKDASYAVYRLQDRLYRDNLLSASLVDPTQKPEKKPVKPKEDPKKKKAKPKNMISLRLLSPINPPTPPPPQSLSQSNPSQPLSPPIESLSPPVPSSSNPLPKVTEPEEKNSSGTPDEHYYRNRRGGRRGGGRNNENYNNTQNQNNETYSKRGGRRGRGKMNYVVVEKEEQVDNNTTSRSKNVEAVPAPKPISPVVTPKEKIQNPPAHQPINNTKPASLVNNRRQNNSNNHNSQAKYRPREDSEKNQVSAPTVPVPIQEEYELSLRNAHTNELRFSILVKSSDVEKVLAFYSSLKPY